MLNLSGLQNIARLSLQAHQQALQVTADNIANANTPGYSRRRPIFNALRSGGVRVIDIQRFRDQFLDVRLRVSNSRLGGRRALSSSLRILETGLNESDNSGLSLRLQDFFGAIQDLTVKPSGTAERQSFLSQSEMLIATFKSATESIDRLRGHLDLQIRQEVERVNSLTSGIARINGEIVSAGDARDISSLLDRRDELLNELSGHIPIHTVTDGNGAVVVFGEGGLTLVESNISYDLRVLADPTNDGYARIGSTGIVGGTTLISGRLTDGSLGALLEARDEEAPDLLNRLEIMAAEMIRSFNGQHRLGMGLDGVAGRDFFTGLDVTVHAAVENSGDGVATASSITDEALLTFNDYEIRFTAGGLYDVVNVSTGATLSTGTTYSSGAAIGLDGISVTIIDGTSAPAQGDVFRINSYDGTAARFGLSSDVLDNPQAVAAGLTAEPGDNENALALAAFRDASLFGNGSATFEEFYSAARSKLGLGVQAAENALADEEVSQFQIQRLAEAVSGVSLDEEAVNLIVYQRAFEASSRLIGVSDELLQTILNML